METAGGKKERNDVMLTCNRDAHGSKANKGHFGLTGHSRDAPLESALTVVIRLIVPLNITLITMMQLLLEEAAGSCHGDC